MDRKHQRGFTLVEIIVALTILSIGIIAIMRLFPTSIQQTRIAAERQQAAFLAKTELGKLRAAGVGAGLNTWAEENAFRSLADENGDYRGMFKSWTSTVKRVSSDVDLYRVTLSVEMFDGRRERFVTYVTEQ
jgi:prepilin-type N-terminal cleavage/methylation domain-containing protein